MVYGAVGVWNLAVLLTPSGPHAPHGTLTLCNTVLAVVVAFCGFATWALWRDK